ncbi:MAG: YdcF family protein [Pseudomonadota bacterium]|nr:YdcF family protein [Pseudomonadota bacterium]
MLSRLIALGLLLYVLGYALFAVLLPRPAGNERTDAVVVLTGGSGRLERGFETVQRGLSRRMLISGVERTVRPVDLAAVYKVDPQLFECCVDLGRESFDTRSNADEVARWVERRRIRSIRLVTHDLHMPRARYELRKRVGDGLAIVADAVPTNPDFGPIFLEYNKYLLGRAADLIGI